MIAYTVSLGGKVVYVGIYSRSTDPTGRWKQHINLAYKGLGGRLHSAIRDMGAEAFFIEAVACARTWSDLCALERMLITQHKTYCWRYKQCYNMTTGGDGGFGIKAPKTPEWRAKIAAAHLGKKRSAAARAAMSAAQSRNGISPERQAGMITARSGKMAEKMKNSDEWRNNISKALTGHIVTQETRDKISEKAKARGKQSAETIAKQVAGRAGYRHSEEARKKMSELQKGRPLPEKTRQAVIESNRRRARSKSVA